MKKLFLLFLILLYFQVSCDEGSSSSNSYRTRDTSASHPVVPEPTSVLLYGVGMLILTSYLRRRR